MHQKRDIYINSFGISAVLASCSLHQCYSPPIDLKCAARPTIDPGGGRISPAVGGSTRLRSFWLCYGREAILESCLLCSSGTVGTCVQTFVVNFSRAECDVDDVPVRSDGPLRFCASGRWRKLAQIFSPSWIILIITYMDCERAGKCTC